MDRSRTPLEKWAAAIECLSTTNGVNAKQLAERIDVSHKTAWLMLRKFRLAIGAAEASKKLHGTVLAGLETLAPRYLFLFLPDRRFRKERVVVVTGSVMPDGRLSAVKIGTVEEPLLKPGTKQLTDEGAEQLLERYAASSMKWLDSVKMYQSSLRECLQDAKGWMNHLFNGLGTKYIQSYLDEYSFRWNAGADGRSLRNCCYEALLGARTTA
jgi:hypothetical protein